MAIINIVKLIIQYNNFFIFCLPTDEHYVEATQVLNEFKKSVAHRVHELELFPAMQ